MIMKIAASSLLILSLLPAQNIQADTIAVFLITFKVLSSFDRRVIEAYLLQPLGTCLHNLLHVSCTKPLCQDLRTMF